VKILTGVRRLDDLLGGGLPEGSFALVYGPPFAGKEVLARRFLAQSIARGDAALGIVTNATASEFHKDLARSAGNLAVPIASGLLHTIDAYSRVIGFEEDPRLGTELVDGLASLNDLGVALGKVHREITKNASRHALVLDSVSTLAIQTSPQATFRFLQVFIGMARRAGATGMLLVDHGMHADADVQAFKHLCHGIIEVKRDGDRHLLRVEGLGAPPEIGWTEYRFDEANVEITGSFSGGRIR